MRGLTVVVLVAATLAGCLDDDSGTTQEADTTGDMASAPPAVEPFNASFEWEMAAAASAVVLTVNVGGPLVGPSWDTVSLPEGMPTVEATADGSCVPEPTCSFALVAYRNDELHSYVEGALPLTLTIDEPGKGGWDLVLYPDLNGSVIVTASGTVTVSGTPAA